MCEDVVVVKLVKNIFLSLIFQLSPDDKDTKNIALNSKLLFKMLHTLDFKWQSEVQGPGDV